MIVLDTHISGSGGFMETLASPASKWLGCNNMSLKVLG